MPVIKSAQKQVRSSARRRANNLRRRSLVKSALHRMNEKPAADTLSAVYKALDKAAHRGTIHRKKAARLKSRMSRKLRAS